MQDCHVCDALSSRNILPAHTGSTLASPASSGFRDRRQRGAGGHSLVVIMNGAGEGSHTDAAAGQVDQFTQPVFEAERKRKRFVVGTPRKQNKPSMCSFQQPVFGNTRTVHFLKSHWVVQDKTPVENNSHPTRLPGEIPDHEKLRFLRSHPGEPDHVFPFPPSFPPWERISNQVHESVMANQIQTMDMKEARF